MFPVPLLSIRQAQSAANMLSLHPQVEAVLLFGSLARDGVGNDADIILVMPEEYVQAFIEQTYSATPFNDVYSTPRRRRFDTVTRLLGFVFQPVMLDAWTAMRGGIDLFIFPHDWRERLPELQASLSHWDPMFMQNVAGDARVLVSKRELCDS